jgi:peptidoglycan hydrolase-like protein with peptidoglycan-binding domain
MKARPIFIAVAAMFSAGAIAGGAQHSSSQGASQGAGMEQSQRQAQNPAQNPEVVKQAQEKLSAAGIDAGQPDGKVGPKTQAALKEFQEKEGLQASGQLDSETLAALEISTPEGTTTSSSAGSSGGSSSASSGSSSPGASPGSSSPERAAEPQPQSGSEQPKPQ